MAAVDVVVMPGTGFYPMLPPEALLSDYGFIYSTEKVRNTFVQSDPT